VIESIRTLSFPRIEFFLGMFQTVFRVVFVLIVPAAGNLFAQTKGPSSLAGLVLSEISALDAAPDLTVWRNLHPNERLKNADYDNEYETQGLWCAASVAEFTFPGGVKATRQAFFYVPSGKPGDTLPGHQDASLLRQCRLLAFWYEVDNPAGPGELAKTVSAGLGASLGSADEPSRFKRTDGDWGSGYWSPYRVWERANRRIVLAVDPGGPIPIPHAHTRLLVIARSSLAPRGLSFDWSGGGPKGQPSLKGAAEGARVARLENPCSFDDGQNNWQGGLISFGEKLLRDFPARRWKSYIHLTMARAYAAELILTYSQVDLNGANKPTGPEALRRAAIAHFRAFLEGNQESAEARSAWKEAWRLLAGLPPSPIHFACTD
jgi:hypothetical protein